MKSFACSINDHLACPQARCACDCHRAVGAEHGVQGEPGTGVYRLLHPMKHSAPTQLSPWWLLVIVACYLIAAYVEVIA